MISIQCDNCGVVFERHPSQLFVRGSKHNFCGLSCYHEFACGENNGSWKGGRVIHKPGYYVHRRVRGHPNANAAGYVPEHRLVMEFILDRFLEPGECVHHRDEDKQNNEASNLGLFESVAAHSKHHKDLDAMMQGNWPKELV